MVAAQLIFRQIDLAGAAVAAKPRAGARANSVHPFATIRENGTVLGHAPMQQALKFDLLQAQAHALIVKLDSHA